ncbi:Probable protein S-acyltransferase 15 [Striga hermonthica]|uniref:S-acyltransferase n=1 Tax=Striga hermonthica TaxID=68872 RepID=A0A9N7N8J7_STRHE|nr:Probable protein S-acyltransferase 15 [Striga hermonthica]
MKLKRFLSIHVLSVFFLLGFIYYETTFVFIEDWYGLQSSAGLLNSLIFSFLAFLCVFSLLVCVLSDPGGVPSGYIPDVEDSQGSDQESKRNGAHTRLCDKCSVHKPPRAHHCRVCRMCVLRMDHHCSWINNCVGLKNYKSFLLLLFYATAGSTYSAIVIICCTLEKNWDSIDNHPAKILHVVCGVMSIGVSLVLGSFLVWHIFLTCRNMTTIEYYDAKRAAWLARKSGLSYHHPYDVGSFKNISLILGPNMLKWLWPTCTSHIKDGLNYPSIRDSS